MKKLLDRIQFIFTRLFSRDSMPAAQSESIAQTAEYLSQHPYPGLNSYNEERELYFHGRDRERRAILEILELYSICFLIGKSGMGKSSLIEAGLVPELRRKNQVPVKIRINFDDPADLTLQVKCTIEQELQKVDAKVAPFGDLLLWEYFQQVKLFNGFLKPVLIFDQFEEIFTRGSKRHDQLTRLLVELIDLAENRVPHKVQLAYRSSGQTVPSNFKKEYKIIFALREDYLPQLIGLRIYIPTLRFSIFRLEQMQAQQAFDAVYRPGQEAGLIKKNVAWQIVGKIPQSEDHEFDLSAIDSNNIPGGREAGPATSATPAALVTDPAGREKPSVYVDPELVTQAAGPAVEEPVTQSNVEEAEHSVPPLMMQKKIEPFLLNLLCYTLNEERLQKKPVPDHITERDVERKDFSLLVSNYYEKITKVRPGLSLAIEQELLTPDGKFRQFAPITSFQKAGRLRDGDIEYLIKNKLIRRKRMNDLDYFELIHDVLIPVVRSRRKGRNRVGTAFLIIGIAIAASMTFVAVLNYTVKRNREHAIEDLKVKFIKDSMELAAKAKELALKATADSNYAIFLNQQAKVEQDRLQLQNERKNDELERQIELGRIKRKKDSLDIAEAKARTAQFEEKAKVAEGQRRFFDSITMEFTALQLANNSLNEVNPIARNTMAVLAYRTLYENPDLSPARFDDRIFAALINTRNITPANHLNPPDVRQPVQYKNVDAAYSQQGAACFVRPFGGISSDRGMILDDKTLVHAWINKTGSRAATVLQHQNGTRSLVIMDLKGKVLHDPVDLELKEDVMAVAFDPVNDVCAFSTRIASSSGALYVMPLTGSGKPVKWMEADNKGYFLLCNWNKGFTAVSSSGQAYTWLGFQHFDLSADLRRKGFSTVSAVCYGGKGSSQLFTGLENGRIYQSDWSGNRLFFAGGGVRISVLASSPDGKWLACGDQNGNVLLWRMDIFQPIAIYLEKYIYVSTQRSIVSIFFDSTSQTLTAVSETGASAEYSLSMKRLVEDIRKEKKFLRRDEWKSYITDLNYIDL